MKKSFLILILFSSVGCYTPTKTINKNNNLSVSINSYGDENRLSKKTYILRPFDSSVASNYLLFKELSIYIIRELKEKGYKYTENEDSAECVIFLKYGTGDPQTFEKEIYYPIYGQTGISSATTVGNSLLTYYPGSTSVTYKEETNYTHTYGQTGEAVRKVHETYFAHYMVLSAFDSHEIKNDFNRSIRWKIISKLISKDEDIRRQFPFLVFGSDEYIGKNSHEITTSLIDLADPKLEKLRTGINPSDNKQVILSNDEIQINLAKKAPSKFKKYTTFSDIKIGDVVMYKSFYGENVYGIVEKNSHHNIDIKTFPSVNSPQIDTVTWKELLKAEQ
jgi:hypothetical protein